MPAAQPLPEAPRCSHCGVGSAVLKTGTGRCSPYRNLASVPIPDSLPLPTCNRCGQLSLNGTAMAELLPCLEAQYQRILRERARQAIDALVKHVSQRKLERLLGLSLGYLCRLRSGKRTSSSALVILLTSMAAAPAAHLKQLGLQWSYRETLAG